MRSPNGLPRLMQCTEVSQTRGWSAEWLSLALGISQGVLQENTSHRARYLCCVVGR